MQPNSLILLRGLPGSGKSTLARLLSENGKYPVYSVDDYFTDPETGNTISNLKKTTWPISNVKKIHG